MANVEMSLDEIISLQKKQRGSGRGGGVRRGGRQSTHSNNNSNSNNRRPQKRFVDFDAARGPSIGSGNPNKSVRVNITNLAPSVLSSDLEELFGKYNVEAALVHHNEYGHSLGTGDIYLGKRDALRVIKDFAGVALDGQIMKMFLVDGAQDLGSRLDFSHRSRGVQRKETPKNVGNRRRGGNGQRGGNVGGRGKTENRTKKSEAELDAELDAYMNTSKA